MEETLYQQAISGVHILRGAGGAVVLVDDGCDYWLCTGVAWNAMQARLEGRRPYIADPCVAHSRAYGILCSEVAGPIASRIGTSRGAWEDLVTEAYACSLITQEEAALYGVRVEVLSA